MIPESVLERVVEEALEEDAPFGDITTEAVVEEGVLAEGAIKAKEELVVCGTRVAELVFKKVDPSVEVSVKKRDGEVALRGEEIVRVKGSARSLLVAERVALNFLQHLSAVATLARRFVEKVKDLPVRICDTRKTLPGLRALQKYAVRVGGAHNHRFDLSSGFLLKDNHIKACGGIKNALKKLGSVPHPYKVEVEVKNLEELREALEAGAEVILLDNMSVELLREAVRLARSIRPSVVLEASGGITLENVREVAETGVDVISCGALTHSVTAVDINFEIERVIF